MRGKFFSRTYYPAAPGFFFFALPAVPILVVYPAFRLPLTLLRLYPAFRFTTYPAEPLFFFALLLCLGYSVPCCAYLAVLFFFRIYPAALTLLCSFFFAFTLLLVPCCTYPAVSFPLFALYLPGCVLLFFFTLTLLCSYFLRTITPLCAYPAFRLPLTLLSPYFSSHSLSRFRLPLTLRCALFFYALLLCP